MKTAVRTIAANVNKSVRRNNAAEMRVAKIFKTILPEEFLDSLEATGFTVRLVASAGPRYSYEKRRGSTFLHKIEAQADRLMLMCESSSHIADLACYREEILKACCAAGMPIKEIVLRSCG